MDRAFRASKRGAAAEETTPKKRKRSPSLPRTPGQGDEPAPAAEDLSPPRKKQLFANAVQLSRCVKVRRCCGRAAAPRRRQLPPRRAACLARRADAPARRCAASGRQLVYAYNNLRTGLTCGLTSDYEVSGPRRCRRDVAPAAPQLRGPKDLNAASEGAKPCPERPQATQPPADPTAAADAHRSAVSPRMRRLWRDERRLD